MYRIMEVMSVAVILVKTCMAFIIAIAQILCMYWMSADSSVHGLCKYSLCVCEVLSTRELKHVQDNIKG